jgi:hypothetical protein
MNMGVGLMSYSLLFVCPRALYMLSILSPSLIWLQNHIGFLERLVPKKQVDVQASQMLWIYLPRNDLVLGFSHSEPWEVTHICTEMTLHFPVNACRVRTQYFLHCPFDAHIERHADNLLQHRRRGPILLNVAGVIWLLCGFGWIHW